MKIDTHCHIDLFDDPISLAKEFELKSSQCVMMTNLPSHYQLALPYLKGFRNISPALGLHPLRTSQAINEIDTFIKYAEQSDYIGEVGLDYSAEGVRSKELQLSIFSKILPHIKCGKFVSIHCRNAHQDLIDLLVKFNVRPVCFHYFTGSMKCAISLVKYGHFFSVNSRMCGKQYRELIQSIPKTNVLVESDGPFLTKFPLRSIAKVYSELASIWNISLEDAEKLIEENFYKCKTFSV